MVDFGKSQDSFGKKRPAVIFQTDKLNFAVDKGIYDYYLVIPLSTQKDPITDDFRLKISPRENLERECYVVCNSICFLSKKFIGPKIAALSEEEIGKVHELLKDALDM